MLWPITVARLSHTVCCLWLQQLRFISFCLLQHNCCQYSCEIFQENELQQKWVSSSRPSCLSRFLTHIFYTCVKCICVYRALELLKFNLCFHENKGMMESINSLGLALLSHMTSLTSTLQMQYMAHCCSTKSNVTTKWLRGISFFINLQIDHFPRVYVHALCMNSFPL